MTPRSDLKIYLENLAEMKGIVCYTLYFPRTGWRPPVINMSSPRSSTQRTAWLVLYTI